MQHVLAFRTRLPADGPPWLTDYDRSVVNLFRQMMPGPFTLHGYSTADVPDPAEFSHALIFDHDVGAPYWSDGVSWHGFDPSAAVQASDNLAAGALCNVYTSGGAARVRNANATDLTKPANAFAKLAALSTASATLYFAGQIITGLSGLTPGTTYYLATTSGAVTATPPSADGNGVQEIGVALSATTLAFQPKAMIGI